MSQLIIKQDYLIAKSVISSNTDFKFLTPVIEWVQDLKLRPLLGTNLFNLIIAQTTPVVALTPANQTLVDSYILKFLLFHIMSDSVITMKYKYSNIGIVSRDASGQGAQPISVTESKDLMDFYKNKAEQYGQLMVRYIRANPTLYPAYYSNTGMGDIIPESDSFDTGIYLPDRNIVFDWDNIDWKKRGLNPFGND
jgi:hypothetical protein